MENTRSSVLTVAGLVVLAACIAIGGRAYGQVPGQQTLEDDRGKFERKDCKELEKEDREKLDKENRLPLSCQRAKAKRKPPGTPAQAIFTPTPPPTPPGTTIEKQNAPRPPVPQGPFVPGGGHPIPFTQGAIVSPSLGTPSPDPPGDFHFFVNNGLSVPSA